MRCNGNCTFWQACWHSVYSTGCSSKFWLFPKDIRKVRLGQALIDSLVYVFNWQNSHPNFWALDYYWVVPNLLEHQVYWFIDSPPLFHCRWYDSDISSFAIGAPNFRWDFLCNVSHKWKPRFQRQIITHRGSSCSWYRGWSKRSRFKVSLNISYLLNFSK